MLDTTLDEVARDLAARLRERGPEARPRIMQWLVSRGHTEIQALLILARGFATGVLRRVPGQPDSIDVEVAEGEDGPPGVLVIEDDPAVQESVGHILVDEGYRVYQAANGREALRLLPAIPRPSVILLDLMMPVMNGWDFLAVIQRDRELSSIPVAIVSAMAERAPADSKVIRKPIHLDDLLDTVGELCKRSAA